MKKRFLCIIMAGMMLSLSACGNGSDVSKNSAADSESTETAENTDATEDADLAETASGDVVVGEGAEKLASLDIFTGATNVCSMKIIQKKSNGKPRPAFNIRLPFDNYKMTAVDYNGESVFKETKIDSAFIDGLIKEENEFHFVDLWNTAGDFAVELKICDMYESWRSYEAVYNSARDAAKKGDELVEIEDDEHPAFATFDVITGRLCCVNLGISQCGGEETMELKYFLNTDYFYENFDLETIAKQLYNLVRF